MASELDNVFTTLRNDQRRRADENARRRRRRQYIVAAVDTGINLYKANMEKKADDFLNTAQAVQGRNVYNQAQQLSKTYANHAAKAQSYLGGEDAYVMDTFVTPYAQKIAEKDPYFNTKSDFDKAEIIKSFGEKFGDQFKNNYKDIQASLKTLDLSKDYETFLEKENVFSKNMGSDVMRKLFGGKSRTDVILESEEGVIKQISPEIYELTTKDLFNQGGTFSDAKDFIANKIANADTKLSFKGIVKLDKTVIDGKAVEQVEARQFLNEVTNEVVYFPLTGATDMERQIVPSTSYKLKRTIQINDGYGTKEVVVYDDINKTGEKEEVVGSTDSTDKFIFSNAAENVSNVSRTGNTYPKVPIASDPEKYTARVRDVDNYIASNLDRPMYKVSGLFGDKEVSLGDILKEIHKDAESKSDDMLTLETFKSNFSDLVMRESIKIEGIVSEDAKLGMATQIVLNRQERKIKGDFNNLYTGSNNYSSYVNPLEALDAYADLVEQGQINVDGQSLSSILLMMNDLEAVRYTKGLRQVSGEKNAVLNGMFNKQSVKNLFDRDLLNARLVASSEDLEFKEKIINTMEDTYVQLSGIEKPSKIQTEVNDVLDPDKTTPPPSKVTSIDDILSTIDDTSKSNANVIAEVGSFIIDNNTAAKAFRNKDIIFKALERREINPFVAIYQNLFLSPDERSLLDDKFYNKPKLENRLENSDLSESEKKEILDGVEEASKGRDVPPSLDLNATVEETVEYVGNLLGDNDREIEFMKRVVNQESNFGKAKGTNTMAGPKGKRGSFGVAQIDEVAFDQVQKKIKDRKNRLSKFVEPFKEATGIDLTEVTYEQLDNPILSIAFGRMYLRQRTAEMIPLTLEDQGVYWKKYYNTSAGAGKPEDFIRTNQGRE